MLMGVVSMGLAGDEGSSSLPFSPCTQTGSREKCKQTHHISGDVHSASHGTRGWTVWRSTEPLGSSHYFCLHCEPSTHFLQRMKIHCYTPEASMRHLLLPSVGPEAFIAKCSHHRWPAICHLPLAITL